MMSIIEEVENLEDEGLWQTALVRLVEEHEKSPSMEVALRLLFVCWYVLIEGECLDYSEEVDRQEFKKKLEDVTRYLTDNHIGESKVNFYLGYVVSLSAWYFSTEVEEWEANASRMLELAAKMEPENPIYQMVNFGNSAVSSTKYDSFCKRSRARVKDEYAGNGEFNLYFRQVLIR